jgi:putative transcriptional regulator
MTEKLTYKSKISGMVHESALGLYAAGVMDKKTLREFDDLCLTPVKDLTPEEIRAIRENEYVSQAVFARHLNVTTGLISKWECGDKHPTGAALKLLNLVREKGLAAIA